MSISRYLLSLSLLLMSCIAHANSIRFSSDFNSAHDTGSSITDGSYTLTKKFSPSSLVNGALQFNLSSAANEQVVLSLGGTDKIYRIEFDLETENLANSEHTFRLFLDTPTVQSLNFNDCCSNRVSAYNPNSGNTNTNIGSLVDNQSMHVAIDIDLITENWTIDISGMGTHTGGFYSRDGRIEQLRFGLSTAKGGTLPDPSVYATLDNLTVVSQVPLPMAAWLFGSAVIGLVTVGRRKTVQKPT